MSTNSYFSQYESPNIVIVPTNSYNPTSPKRRKIGNNIIVPIVNPICEDKLKSTQNKKPDDDTDTEKIVDKNESSSKNPVNASWATNYLPSIGLDKNPSVPKNRKIPRKTVPQSCVISVESSKIKATEVIQSSTSAPKPDTEKSKQLKRQEKIVTDSNALKDSNTKTKHHVETKNNSIKDKSNKGKQSKHESTKSVSGQKSTDIKSKKSPQRLIRKSKNNQNDSNERKTDKGKKNQSHKEPIAPCTSSKHKQSEKVSNTTSHKDLNAKLLTKSSSVRHRQKAPNTAEETKIKCMVVKESHVQDNKKRDVKTRHNQTKSDGAKLSASCSTSNYKEKQKSPTSSMEEVNLQKNVTFTTKPEVRDSNKLAVLKKAQHNAQLKTKVVSKRAKINTKTKNQDKSTKTKSDLSSRKKIIKSPIKKKTAKTKSYNKIKLVINVICNNKTNSQNCNENFNDECSNDNTTCTVPNVDLDFLNDFDIDEIVKSLDSCEKKTSQHKKSDRELNKCKSKENRDRHSVISNIHNDYNNTDVLDLIKILKGEEEDDLLSAKQLLFSNDLDSLTQGSTSSQTLDNVSKMNSSKIPKDPSSVPVKMKEERKHTLLSDIIESVASSAESDKKNSMRIKNLNSIQIGNICDINGVENAKDIQRTIIRKKAEESSQDDIQSSLDSVRKETLATELQDNIIKSNTKVKKEQNNIPFISNRDSHSILNNIKADSKKKMALHQAIALDMAENQNEEKYESVSVRKNHFNEDSLNHQSAENLFRESLICKSRNVSNAVTIDEINHNKTTDCSDTLSKLETEINNKDKRTNERKQKNISTHIIHEENPNPDYQKYAGKQEEGKVVYYNEKCIEAIKVKNSDNQNDNHSDNSINQKSFLQDNDIDVNAVKNNGNQNKLALINDTVKDEIKLPSEKVKVDEHEIEKKEPVIEEVYTENKDKELTDKVHKHEGDKNEAIIEEVFTENKEKELPDTVDKHEGEKKEPVIEEVFTENKDKELPDKVHKHELEKNEAIIEKVFTENKEKELPDTVDKHEGEKKEPVIEEVFTENKDKELPDKVHKHELEKNEAIIEEVFTENKEKVLPDIVEKHEGEKKEFIIGDVFTEIKEKEWPEKVAKHEGEKKEPIIEEVFAENKEKELPENSKETMDAQSQLCDNDKNAYSNIKSKVDLETIVQLEERLCTDTGSKYSIISIIHTGKFSKLFKCKHPNGKYYALKMPTTNIKFNQGREKKQMMYSLTSDIPKDNLFIVCLANAFSMGEKWCFLMEYYPKNLHQVLSEAGKPFSIQHVQEYARQLVMAVMVLRNKNMVHLDIQPKHILINSSNNLLKLCGFDNMCYINKMRILPNVGTVNYRAPEVILGYETGFEIDVWSTGLVLYEMATNKRLFPGIYNNDILYKQICTLGCVPYDMIKRSRFRSVHFLGTKFLRKTGFKGQNVNVVSKFYKNNKLCDSIYDAYYENWGNHRSISQQNCDIGKVSLFVKLLQKMLAMHPEFRLPIEFVYANPFIYDAYSYQEW